MPISIVSLEISYISKHYRHFTHEARRRAQDLAHADGVMCGRQDGPGLAPVPGQGRAHVLL